jgi:hypothetical protein
MARPVVLESQREEWRREFAAENVWVSQWPRRLVDLSSAVAVAAVVLDVAMTYFALSDPGYSERNPFVASAMASIGLTPTLLVAALVRVALIGTLAYLATRAVRPVVRYAALTTMVGAAVWWCAVDFSNAVALARGPMGR